MKFRKKTRTTRTHRRQQQNVLHLRVSSPRIAWFGFLKIASHVGKFAAILAFLGGVGWLVWFGLDKALFKNPDFRLQVLLLNENSVIDELGVAEVAGIDLAEKPSMFHIKARDVAKKLKALPEVKDAEVELNLPCTMLVEVKHRSPQAWVVCSATGEKLERKVGGILVDENYVAYPCPEKQFSEAAKLPIIDIPQQENNTIRIGEKLHCKELERCSSLLHAVKNEDPSGVRWVQMVRQSREWALELQTREGTVATFGLDDHSRQIRNLRGALDHAAGKGYTIETINLIPKYNIPITVKEDAEAPPRAIIVSPESLNNE